MNNLTTTILIYLLIINVVTFIVYGIDSRSQLSPKAQTVCSRALARIVCLSLISTLALTPSERASSYYMPACVVTLDARIPPTVTNALLR